MAPIADFIVAHVPLLTLPHYLTRYVAGQTPLSTTNSVVAAIASYLAVIFSLQNIMKSQAPLKLRSFVRLHNIVLSIGSAVLLVLMVEEIAPIVWKHGLFYGICDEGAWTSRLEFYYTINYYIKYVELMDTVFLALKKKPLPFLHVFHHSATALLCFTQLNGRTSVSWVPITLNLSVHVLLYYYYYATAGGARIWWKKYLTIMQIIQFILDLFAVYFGTYSYFVATYIPRKLPVLGTCAGTEGAAIFGCLLLTSYLGLFIDFYFKTYNKKTVANGNGIANGVANRNAKSNGIANGKAN